MYDVTNRESFTNLDVWFNELDTYATTKDIVKMVVGNKIDDVMHMEGGGTNCIMNQKQNIGRKARSGPKGRRASRTKTLDTIHRGQCQDTVRC